MVLTVLVLVISCQPKMSSSCWKSLRIRPSPDHLNKTVDHHLTYPWTSLTTLSQEILTFTWLLPDLHMTTWHLTIIWQSSDLHLNLAWPSSEPQLTFNWQPNYHLTFPLHNIRSMSSQKLLGGWFEVWVERWPWAWQCGFCHIVSMTLMEASLRAVAVL